MRSVSMSLHAVDSVLVKRYKINDGIWVTKVVFKQKGEIPENDIEVIGFSEEKIEVEIQEGM